jgi:hypothetical protein
MRTPTRNRQTHVSKNIALEREGAFALEGAPFHKCESTSGVRNGHDLWLPWPTEHSARCALVPIRLASGGEKSE